MTWSLSLQIIRHLHGRKVKYCEAGGFLGFLVSYGITYAFVIDWVFIFSIFGSPPIQEAVYKHLVNKPLLNDETCRRYTHLFFVKEILIFLWYAMNAMYCVWQLIQSIFQGKILLLLLNLLFSVFLSISLFHECTVTPDRIDQMQLVRQVSRWDSSHDNDLDSFLEHLEALQYPSIVVKPDNRDEIILIEDDERPPHSLSFSTRPLSVRSECVADMGKTVIQTFLPQALAAIVDGFCDPILGAYMPSHFFVCQIRAPKRLDNFFDIVHDLRAHKSTFATITYLTESWVFHLHTESFMESPATANEYASILQEYGHRNQLLFDKK